MKTKEEILKELYNTQFVENYTKRLLKQQEFLEDAVGEIWLIVAELPEDKLQNLYNEGGINKVRQLISGIVSRQINSKNSKFYYKYIKKNTKNIMIKRTADKKQHYSEDTGWLDDISDEVDEYEDIVNGYKKLDDIEKNLLKAYIDCNYHISTLARMMNVSVPFLKPKIEQIKKKVKDNIL